jgi:acyl-CoA dehydrogenase
MVPVSHVLWTGVWLGIASDAYERARRFLQVKSRKDPDGSVIAANRLAGLATRLAGLRGQLAAAIASVEARPPGDAERAAEPGAVLAINDLKLAASDAVVAIINEAIQVIGIAAYRNEGEWSLGRQLRDAHSAALMINNDRIRATNADLLLVYKGR